MNTVWFCRNASEFHAVASHERDREPSDVISDDASVRELVGRHFPQARFRWLNTASVYDVAPAVQSIVDWINNWLSDLSKDLALPEESLRWIRHAEGGHTTQRLQNTLLLVQSISQALSHCRPVRAVSAFNGSSLDGQVIAAILRARQVPHVDWSGGVGAALTWREGLLVALRTPYEWLRVARYWPRRFRLLPAGTTALIQLCDATERHVDLRRQLARAFSSRGLKVGIVCWRAGRASRVFSKAGCPSIDLESWLSVRDLFRSWRTENKLRRAAAARWQRDAASLEYLGVPLSSLLWPSMRIFLSGESAAWHQFGIASTRFAQSVRAEILQPWTVVLQPAAILFAQLSRRKVPTVVQPAAFPFEMRNPYLHRRIPVHIEGAVSERHRKALLTDDVPHRRVVVTGFQQAFNISRQQGASAEVDRRAAGLPAGFTWYVGVDVGYPLPGYMSSREQIELLTRVLAAAEANPSTLFALKPHPNHRGHVLSALGVDTTPRNVIELPAGANALTFLQGVDLLITKYSTLGIEMMQLKKPVLSALLDGDERFRAFGFGAEYVTSGEELAGFLASACGDEQWRRGWIRNRLKLQADYIEGALAQSSEAPFNILAGAIVEELDRHA